MRRSRRGVSRSSVRGALLALLASAALGASAAPGYAKGSNWVETVVSYFGNFRTPQEAESVSSRLLQDFPSSRRAIASGYIADRPATNDLVSLAAWAKALGLKTNETATAAAIAIETAVLARARRFAADRRTRTLLKYFDPVARERAIVSLSAKYPEMMTVPELSEAYSHFWIRIFLHWLLSNQT